MVKYYVAQVNDITLNLFLTLYILPSHYATRLLSRSHPGTLKSITIFIYG
jgi:hypothetical protein